MSLFQAWLGGGGRTEANSTPRRERFIKLALEKPEKVATIGGKSSSFQLNNDQMATACKHPRVRIVSRHDDTEYVECMECGEVFDSDEFQDMAIEETADEEAVPDDE